MQILHSLRFTILRHSFVRLIVSANNKPSPMISRPLLLHLKIANTVQLALPSSLTKREESELESTIGILGVESYQVTRGWLQRLLVF